MMHNPQIVSVEFESRVLADNPLGDPALREFPVYLPPDYHTAERRYPVIWALPAFMSWGQRMLNLTAWDENLPQRADRLIREGKLPPMIIAFPNCFTRYGGSQYINSSAVGRYEDYVIDELVPFIDQQFRTLQGPQYRAVMGHSSGGFGALWLAMRHPDVFSAVAAHAADMGFEFCYWPDIPGTVRTLAATGGIEGFWHSFNLNYKSRDWNNALGLIGMSACYSPNPQNPHGFDLLCDPYTGAVREDIWQRWQQFDPVCIAPTYAEALRGLRALYVDCGTRDEYNLFLGARRLHQLLDKLQVAHRYEEFDGGHSGMNWRYEISLPHIATAITSAG